MEKKEEKAKLAEEQLGKVSGGATSIFGYELPDGLVCPVCGKYDYMITKEDGSFICCNCDVRFDRYGNRLPGDAQRG